MRDQSLKSQNLLSIILMVGGLIIAAIGILADTINIGGGKGFGYYQMIVLIAGVVTFLIGIAVMVSQHSHTPPPDEFSEDL